MMWACQWKVNDLYECARQSVHSADAKDMQTRIYVEEIRMSLISVTLKIILLLNK